MLVFVQPMELPRDRIVQVIQVIVAQAFIVTHTVSGTKSVRSHLPKKMNAKQVKIDRSSSILLHKTTCTSILVQSNRN